MTPDEDKSHELPEEETRLHGKDPSSPAAPAGDSPSHPERIGPFQILRVLGQGGMGRVFLARQEDPVDRQVALKVVRSRFLDHEARQRFESERQAMARLQHPHVAQILEAGATDEGHPYFVMEYVDGERITDYCDRKELSIDERIALFRDVCSGVEHAHQKGILHRDLKPSNVLVTAVDGRAIPKIIDFGIAKAIDQPLVDETQLTGDRLIGTPAYLSPEAIQLRDDPLDLDTRSDVYSLGVLLYELLIGKRPFGDRGSNVLKVLSRITEEDAPGPSTRWSQLGASEREAVAQQRRLDATNLRRRLRGDLDWIVLKAIARDRQDRYGSAAELSRDLERCLAHLPVSAGPLSTTYRLRKFMRRRIGVVVSATLVVLALAAGIVARSLEADRANREAAAALAAKREAEVALDNAEKARAEADEISRFLTGLFEVSDPGEAMGNTVTARELLDNAAADVREGFAGQPLAKARFMQSIGDVYRKLGLFGPAEELFEEALEIRRNHLPPQDLLLAESLNGLGALRAQLGHFEEAEPLFREALEIRERHLGADDPKLAGSLNNLANLSTELGHEEEAEALYRRSIEIAESHTDTANQDRLVALNNLATLYFDTGRPEDAEPLLRSFLELQRAQIGERHPHVAIAMMNLADVRALLDSPAAAEPLYREACEILEDVLGSEHADLGYCWSGLAKLLADQGRDEEAEQLYRAALRIQSASLPRNHPERQATVEGLAALLRSQGRTEEASELEAQQ